MSQTTIPLGDTATTATAAGDFAHLPLERVWADPDQPRRTFDEAFLAQLSESIKTQGVIQPIVVRPTSASEATYTIISGESRWRASQMAGKDTIPALIRRDLSEGDIAVMQILENLQRRDLTLIETCEGVTRLVKEIGLDKAAEQLGMSKSWVSRHSTLAELPPEVLDLVKVGKVESIEVAKDLGQLVQLDPKKGALAVGRLRGELDRWGHPVRDLHGSLNDPEADEEDRAEAQAWQERQTTPPTRAEVREELRLARAAVEEKARAQAAKQAAKDDPVAQAEKEKARKKIEADKRAAQRRKDYTAEQDAFEIEHTNTLCSALGLPVPKRREHGWPYDAIAHVEGKNFNYSYGPPPPKSVEVADFDIELRAAPLAIFERFEKAGIGVAIKIELQGAFTLNVAKAKALQDLLGEKHVTLKADVRCTGAELPKLIARLQAPAIANPKAKPADGRRTMTSIEQFLYSDAVATKEGARIKASDLHAAYSRWCKKNKLTPISLRDNAFGSAITAEGYESKRSNGIVYLDIEVKA